MPTESLHVRSLCALELPKPLPSEEATRKFLQQIFESTGRTSAQGLLGSGTQRDSTSASPGARAPGRPGGGAGTAFARRVAVAHPGPQPASSTFTRNCPHLWLSAAQVFGANSVNHLSLCKDPGCLQAEARLRLSSEVFSGGSLTWGLHCSPLTNSSPQSPPSPGLPEYRHSGHVSEQPRVTCMSPPRLQPRDGPRLEPQTPRLKTARACRSGGQRAEWRPQD